MAEAETTMDLMTQKLTEPGTGAGTQGPWALPTASWMTLERYAKKHLQIPVIIIAVFGVTNLEEGEGRIRIMFQNMVRMGNVLDQPIQNKLDTVKRKL